MRPLPKRGQRAGSGAHCPSPAPSPAALVARAAVELPALLRTALRDRLLLLTHRPIAGEALAPPLEKIALSALDDGGAVAHQSESCPLRMSARTAYAPSSSPARRYRGLSPWDSGL